MLAAMDEAIGQILDAVDEGKMRENTLVLFTATTAARSRARSPNNGPLRGGKGDAVRGRRARRRVRRVAGHDPRRRHRRRSRCTSSTCTRRC